MSIEKSIVTGGNVKRSHLFVLGLSLVAACGSDKCGDDDALTPDAGSDPGVDAAIIDPENVVSFEHHETLAPGGEFDHCKFVQAPPEGMIVNRAELEYVSGNHHTFVYTTSYTEIPTVDLTGTVQDTSGIMDCHDLKYLAWAVTGNLLVAVSADSGDILNLPPGVGIKIPPNGVLLYSVHQINTTDRPMQVDNKVNFHTIPEAELETEAGMLFLYDLFIDVPAGATSQARQVCPVPRDITLTTLQAHTHRYGTHEIANLVDGNGEILEQLYENTSYWDRAIIEQFPDGKLLPAGTGIDFRCDFENTGDEGVSQGVRATDEMCAMVGAYYPLDEAFAHCNADGNPAAPSASALQIGFGTGTCGETLQCLAAAKPFLEDFGRSMAPCFVNSCASHARTIAATLGCMATVPVGEDPTAVCAAELTTCGEAPACE